MKSISFKNFRKFSELEPIEFKPITMFVGANNSGKSTVVKGLLQIEALMRTPPTFKDREEDNYDDQKGRELASQQKFYFNQNYFAHVCTASRALYKHAKNNVITLQGNWNQLDCTAEILVEDPKNQETVYGIIERICFIFNEQNIRADFNFREKKCFVKFMPLDENVSNLSMSLQSIAKEYNELIGDGVSCEIDISNISTNRYSRTDTLCELLADFLAETINMTADMGKIVIFHYNTKPIDGLSKEASAAIKLLVFGKDRADNKNDRKKYLYMGLSFRWMRLFSRSFEYIYAHSVTQSSSYNVRDTNDYVVNTIHEFANTKRPRNSDGNKFIKKWMQVFGIGFNYHITPFGGEAYMVEVEDEQHTRTQLSDKGMGSIQLMVLLFRLATIIDNGVLRGATIILEEPEQNLHPQIQSRLADLFLDIHVTTNTCLIVETHSEYLIRRTQYLVSTRGWADGMKKAERFKLKDSYEDFKFNPFRVYYFPENGQPYDMEYQENGKFAQRFGSGFFDEASNLELDIIRSNKKKAQNA